MSNPELINYDEIMRIIERSGDEPLGKLIAESGSWDVLYNLSDARADVLRSIQIGKEMKVLEIGAGCGAITSYLCSKAAFVHSTDPSPKACDINALKNRDYRNLKISAGDISKILESDEQKYDVITLIGWADPDKSLLGLLKEKLLSNGRIVIALDNRLGLKYLAGCPVDNSQRLTKIELSAMFEETGFTDYEFYYPYPDYRFASAVYSDESLPSGSDFVYPGHYGEERFLFFDEFKVFDDIAEAGVFPFFSNSYLIVLGGS